jgi:holo-[acyl-carrier protein] synthase
MIKGIGIDIVEVKRVGEKIAKGKGFREYVFSKGEIKYCERQKFKAEHYAGRFAAKEAFFKAMGTGLNSEFGLNEIEVVHDTLGDPSFNFLGKAKLKIKKRKISKIHLSLSHQKSVACAVVIIEV